MKILIDIGHPAHIHLFRPFAIELQKKGYTILFTYREKEFERNLLESYGFNSICIGKHYKSTINKVFGLLKFNYHLLKVAKDFKPDIFLSHGSMYAAQTSYILRKPHISLEDTGNMEQICFYRPFTKTILSPDVLNTDLGLKQISYRSFHELAYLSPKYFTPNRGVLERLQIREGEKYAFIRFVSWKATHDKKHIGLSDTQKEEIVEFLSSEMRVFISSEDKLPDSLQKYSIRIEPQNIHHVLAYSEIVISEGATMASEAGVLGVPSLYVNSQSRCYNEEQEKYSTVFNFRNGLGVLNKIEEIISNSKYQENAKKGSQKLLNDKIDLTALLSWFIENYPNSPKVLRENPNYQDKFKN